MGTRSQYSVSLCEYELGVGRSALCQHSVSEQKQRGERATKNRNTKNHGSQKASVRYMAGMTGAEFRRSTRAVGLVSLVHQSSPPVPCARARPRPTLQTCSRCGGCARM